MKLVTGKTNQVSKSKKGLTICVNANGQTLLYFVLNDYGVCCRSFTIDQLLPYLRTNKIEEINIVIDNDKFVVVPQELFDKADIPLYYSAKAMSCDIYSTFISLADDIVIASNKPVGFDYDFDRVSKVSTFEISHPVSELINFANSVDCSCIALWFSDSYIYIVVKSNLGFQLIETYQFDSFQFVIDLIEIISLKYHLTDFSVVALGNVDEELKLREVLEIEQQI